MELEDDIMGFGEVSIWVRVGKIAGVGYEGLKRDAAVETENTRCYKWPPGFVFCGEFDASYLSSLRSRETGKLPMANLRPRRPLSL